MLTCQLQGTSKIIHHVSWLIIGMSKLPIHVDHHRSLKSWVIPAPLWCKVVNLPILELLLIEAFPKLTRMSSNSRQIIVCLFVVCIQIKISKYVEWVINIQRVVFVCVDPENLTLKGQCKPQGLGIILGESYSNLLLHRTKWGL